MNVKAGAKIAEGGCAEVFEWGGGDRIVKVAKSNTTREAMREERHNTKVAWEIGLPAPQPFEMLEVDGKPAVVYERIHGYSIMERFIREMSSVPADPASETERPAYGFIRMTAEALAQVHRMDADALPLPSQRDKLRHMILAAPYLTASEKEEVVRRLMLLPTRRQVCHGDPNPSNIMVRDGKPVMIDWMNATSGNPEADLAEFVVMVRHAVLPPVMPRAAVERFDAAREDIVAAFCEAYERLTGIGYREVEAWLLPIGARKLHADGISEAEKMLLLREIRARLQASSA